MADDIDRVQIIHPLLVPHRLGVRFLVAIDGFKAPPDSTRSAQTDTDTLPPVVILSLPDPPPQLPLHTLELLLIS